MEGILFEVLKKVTLCRFITHFRHALVFNKYGIKHNMTHCYRRIINNGVMFSYNSMSQRNWV